MPAEKQTLRKNEAKRYYIWVRIVGFLEKKTIESFLIWCHILLKSANWKQVKKKIIHA